MTPDLINGLFEFVGAVFTFRNFRRVVKDEGYAGVSIESVVFFSSWGLWNLYFYPSLQQPASFLGALALVTANVLWITAMFVYGRKQ